MNFEHEGRPLSDLELRAYDAGRTAGDQAAYERGRAEAEQRISQGGWGTAVAAPEEARQLVTFVPPQATGPRAQWLRDTWGGRVARLFPAPDEAAELAAAKQLADQHELTYGSRPALAQFLHKVRGSGTGTSAVLAGDTADVLLRIRVANPDQPIQMVVGPDPAAAQVGGIVTAPGRRAEATGDPAIAAATLEQLARRP